MIRAWSSARFGIALPPGHRFPITKYARVRDGLIARRLLAPARVLEPERADRWDLALVHTRQYIDAVCEGTLDAAAQRRLGFPWGADLRERSLRTAQATLEAARDALDHGAGMNLAGGTHHAFADHGEGFCVFNDVVLAIRVLQREGRLRRAAVIDLDVHQGNGTARLCADDPDAFTFSMHGARNFPFRKERSRLDVELPDGLDDAGYLSMLERHLDDVLADADPELVFYLAGADPYHDDRFGRLRLSMAGLRTRDRRVFRACSRRGLPVVMLLAGGYARQVDDIVEIHSATVEELLRAHG